MKKIIIILIIVVAVAVIIIGGFYILNRKKEADILKEKIDLIENFDGEIRAFSFNRYDKNDMAEDRGDSLYFYLKKSSVTLELWGYGREDVIEKETKISPEEFEKLKQDVLLWIDKYDILALAKAEIESEEAESEDKVYATDTHSSFYIKIYCLNNDEIVITEYNEHIDEMASDLERIFAYYK